MRSRSQRGSDLQKMIAPCIPNVGSRLTTTFEELWLLFEGHGHSEGSDL